MVRIVQFLFVAGLFSAFLFCCGVNHIAKGIGFVVLISSAVLFVTIGMIALFKQYISMPSSDIRSTDNKTRD